MIVDTLDLRPVAGPNRSPLYVESTYKGMHVELHFGSLSSAHEWEWAFYDSTSPDPDFAVARGTQPSYVAAEKELIDYIDGHVAVLPTTTTTPEG